MSHIVGQLTIIFARRKETGTQTAQHLSDEDITPSELDSQLTAPGRCRHLGYLRNFLAEGDCAAGVVSIVIP